MGMRKSFGPTGRLTTAATAPGSPLGSPPDSEGEGVESDVVHRVGSAFRGRFEPPDR
jgi:hypothetical protein